MGLKAITFDLWDTVIIDDSDEPKRTRHGLRPKPAERRHLLWEALNRETAIDAGAVNQAFDRQEAHFRNMWYDEKITLSVNDRLEIMLEDLGRSLPQAVRDRLVSAYETMEVTLKPDLIEGAVDGIRALAKQYDLAVISDAIYTPGTGLREILDFYGIKDCFKGFAFSDEVGHAKPHAHMFTEAARQLGTDFSHMVHLGDRDAKDVVGAQAMGMKAVLFTATRDEGSRESTKADAVVDSYADLIGAIDSLAES